MNMNGHEWTYGHDHLLNFDQGALPAGQASHSVASEEPVASKQPNWMVLDGESQVLRNLEKYI